ncbi:hypothetical protein BDW59DRAFT_164206 [Aspergillus cavernicola]|uniref:Uncharacterized protein n=1 Tax=Aspergillus cavernicola TaxID=176166 RepID=A0ABR4I381_9EURO
MTFHMLHILLHRPFLPEGHLCHLGGTDEKHPPQNLPLSSPDLRARQALPQHLHPPPSNLHDFLLPLLRSIYNPIQPGPGARNGANFGLRRPIMIIRSLIEHARLDLNGILAQTVRGATSASALESGAGTGIPGDTCTHGGQQDDSGPIPGAVPFPQGMMNQAGDNTDVAELELEDGDFERLCRDLFSGEIDDGLIAAPHGIDADGHSLLYGLFR